MRYGRLLAILFDVELFIDQLNFYSANLRHNTSKKISTSYDMLIHFILRNKEIVI